MDEILEIAKKYNLYIIEDNAQALGAYFKNKEGKKIKTRRKYLCNRRCCEWPNVST